ncbi:MAG: aldose 1-epimerase [Chloroflexi bacterium]|nr:aldose 1-epimerase [Chloroflexota bacterium]
MSRYTVESTQREGEAIVVLRDTATRATAQVWPGWGNNCFAATLAAPGAAREARGPAPDGRLVTVIEAPPSLDEIRRRPSWWGVPLLFPFPSRISGGAYEFEGRRYRLGRPDQPIVSEGKETPGARRDFHGFVMDLPWRVSATDADDQAATVHSTLTADDHPQTLEGYPFPYRVDATYRLDAHGLSLRFQVTNTGQGNLPFGFGAHPFFRIPLAEAGAPGGCLVHIPAARKWDGRRLTAAAAGETVPWDELCPPVSEEIDLRTPKPFVEGRYNGIYTDLTLTDGYVECFVRDPAAGVETVMGAKPDFRNVVFWSPPGRPELCLEPWTCPSNVFNLAAHGVPHHGLIVLAPGETWEGTMWIGLREAR